MNLIQKVRAFYYDTYRGLFLIKTEKSERENTWTTPGGALAPDESPSDGIVRLVKEETGLIPYMVSPTHFYKITKISSNAQRLEIRAYDVRINVNNRMKSGLEFC